MKFGDKTFVLGVGAQKAGTSWLFDYLSQRGDIYMPRKELHFFDTYFGPLAARKQWLISRRATESALRKDKMLAIRLKGDAESYRRYFKSHTPKRLRLFGEISPSYALIGEDGFRAVRNLFPKVRIIFVMRDPIDRFHSQIRMTMARKGTAKALQRVEGERRSDSLARSQYEQTLKSLESVFVPAEIMYIFYEKLFFRKSIKSLCRFLEVPYVEPDFHKIINASECSSLPIEDDVIAELKPTYQYCREKFGPDLPATWAQFD